MERLSSPISSRKTVPPWAASNFPSFRSSAPVKDPFSWPNSSRSSRDSLRTEQAMGTKGLSWREDCWWMARAATSLPVPFSPRMRTVASAAAARLIKS